MNVTLFERRALILRLEQRRRPSIGCFLCVPMWYPSPVLFTILISWSITILENRELRLSGGCLTFFEKIALGYSCSLFVLCLCSNLFLFLCILLVCYCSPVSLLRPSVSLCQRPL